MTPEEAKAQYRHDIQVSEAALQAQQNQAIMAYFEEAERKAVDMLLSVDLAGDPTTWLRLTTVAQTIRRMKVFLAEARDAGAYAEDALKRMEKEEALDGSEYPAGRSPRG